MADAGRGDHALIVDGPQLKNQVADQRTRRQFVRQRRRHRSKQASPAGLLLPEDGGREACRSLKIAQECPALDFGRHDRGERVPSDRVILDPKEIEKQV
jgi:hypothetical protein